MVGAVRTPQNECTGLGGLQAAKRAGGGGTRHAGTRTYSIPVPYSYLRME